MATGMFSGVPSPNRSVLGAQQLQRPADPYLRQQYPEVYGALGGFMGMAPDEMSGSIFDPNTARVRAGAEYGFPVGTALQVAPLAPMLATGAKATAKALGPTAMGMGERYLQRQGLMPGVVEGESAGMLGGPIKPQAPVSELGFYSATEQAALNLPRKSGTGESFLNDLMKGQDVKKDELSWMGLDDYLKGKPNVTRQEVQDFIASNRVDVQERQLGGLESTQHKENLKKALDSLITQEVYLNKVLPTNISQLDRANLPFWAEAASRGDTYEMAKIDKLNLAPEVKQEVLNLGSKQNIYSDLHNTKTIPSTKYQQYQLPGGENYREILLTLPKEQPKIVPLEGGGGSWGVQMPDGTITSRYYDWNDAAQALRFDAQKSGVTYTSSHFNEPNILAHMRVNDRVDADGKKMLLIEEIQSDWHQAGREKGYIGNYAKGDVKPYTPERAKAEFGLPNNDLFWYFEVPGDTLQIPKSRFGTQDEAMNYVLTEKKVNPEGVPDAPFKDTWHQLALKRALKYAADNGYDRVGLTTGRQQAERYDLSKQITSIEYKRFESGKYNVYYTSDKNSGRRALLGDAKESELEGAVGKDLAKKIIEGPQTNTFSGLDLQVGGEGMKKYYDEIYPAFLAKQGKKYNAKTGETRIKTGQGIPGGAPVRYIDISPEMKGGVKKGQPLFTAAPIGGIGLGAGTQDNEMPEAVRQYMADPRYSDPFADTTR